MAKIAFICLATVGIDKDRGCMPDDCLMELGREASLQEPSLRLSRASTLSCLARRGKVTWLRHSHVRARKAFFAVTHFMRKDVLQEAQGSVWKPNARLTYNPGALVPCIITTTAPQLLVLIFQLRENQSAPH